MRRWNRFSTEKARRNAGSPDLSSVEQRRFIQLNKGIAILFAVFIVLASANTALAWMTDEALLVSEMGLGKIDKGAYAAVVRSPGTGETSLVFGRGDLAPERGEVIDIFYGFEATEQFDEIPWSAYMDSLDAVVFEDTVIPRSTRNWFSGARRVESISGLEMLDMSGVEDASAMFEDCGSLKELDLSGCDAKSLSDMSHMFDGCASLVKVDLTGISNDADLETTGDAKRGTYRIFAGCRSLEEIIVPATFSFTGSDAEHALQVPSVDHIPDADGYWYADQGSLPMTAEDASLFVNSRHGSSIGSSTLRAYGSGYAALYGNSVLVFGRGVPVQEHNGMGLNAVYKGMETAVQDFASSNVPWNGRTLVSVESVAKRKIPVAETKLWFYNQKMLIDADTSSLDLSHARTLHRMFGGCSKLANIDVSDWDTSSATNMAYLFDGCASLVELDVSHWDVSKCGSTYDGLECLFHNCSSVEHLDISNWNVALTSEYFRYGNINYASVNIFSGCSSLKELDLTGIKSDGSYPYPRNWNFSYCDSLEKITVPSALAFRNAAFPTPPSHRGGIANSNFWYEDGRGEPLTSEQACDIIRNAFTVDPSAQSSKTFYASRAYADDDAYAALYGDTLVFGRGADIASSFDGSELNYIYRELEHPSFAPVWRFDGVGSKYIKSVKFLTDIHPSSLKEWFTDLEVLSGIEGLEKLKTETVSDFSSMFENCKSIASLDVSGFDTSNATMMGCMFRRMTTLEELDLFELKASNDLDLAGMISHCSALQKLDLSMWDMPRWTNETRTFFILSGCSALEEITFSPTFNFSKLQTSVYDYDYALPNDYRLKDGFIAAAVWYENGMGRPYSYYDVGRKLSDEYGTRSGSVTWTRYPTEAAYAAVYEESDSHHLHLEFDSGIIDEVADKHPEWELKGIALGYDEYAWRDLNAEALSVPWSSAFDATRFVDVRVGNNVKAAGLDDWFSGFENCTSFDLAQLDVSNVRLMRRVFKDCRAIEELDLSEWDTSSILHIGYGNGNDAVFNTCIALKKVNISGWDFSSTGMESRYLFTNCPSLEEVDMSRCIYPNAPCLFYSCLSLKRLVISSSVSFAEDFPAAICDDESGYDGAWYREGCHEGLAAEEARAYVNGRFGTGEDPAVLIAGFGDAVYAALYRDQSSNSRKLVFGRGAADDAIDGWMKEIEYRGLEKKAFNAINGRPLDSVVPWKQVRTDVVEVINRVPADMPIKPLSLNSWFYEMNRISTLDMSMFDTMNANDLSNMLYGCTSLASIQGLETWNIANVQVMNSAFAGIKADIASQIAKWDTSSVEEMNWLFWACTGLTELDLSQWSTTRLRNAYNAFYQCSNLRALLLPSRFVKGAMTDIGQMFLECNSLEHLDASDWDTSGLSNLNYLFYNCRSLTSIEGLASWKTSKVLEMGKTFYNCSALYANCAGWDISSVTDHEEFAFNASGVIEPNWIDAVVLSDDDNALGVDEDDRDDEEMEPSEEEPEVLRAGEKELALDADAKPLAEEASEGALSQVRLGRAATLQIRFMVNLFTGQRVSSGFYR